MATSEGWDVVVSVLHDGASHPAAVALKDGVFTVSLTASPDQPVQWGFDFRMQSCVVQVVTASDRFGYKLAIVDSVRSEECLLLVFESGAGLAQVWSALAPFHAQSPEDKQHWMSEQIPSCVRCNAGFSVTNRKHHCRLCGKLICKHCSMFTASQPPRRLCVECYAMRASIVVPALQHSSSTESMTSTSTSTPAHTPQQPTTLLTPVEKPLVFKFDLPGAVYLHQAAIPTPAEAGICVGQLDVEVIEGVGLKAADAHGTSDPYAKVILTGYTLAGQEWLPELRTVSTTQFKPFTLEPIWNEHFVFAVRRGGAVLRVEVYDHDFTSDDDLLGVVEIPLSNLYAQQVVDRWYKLRPLAPSVSATADESLGFVHLRLQYRFNPTAQRMSFLWPEQPYVADWPKFTPNRSYSNVMAMLKHLWPFVELIFALLEVLAWKDVYRSAAWMATCILLALKPRLIPVFIHLALAYVCYSNYVNKQQGSNQQAAAQATSGVSRAPANRVSVKDEKLLKIIARRSQQENLDELVVFQTAQTTAATTSASSADLSEVDENSLGVVFNFLGKKLARSDMTTDIQNYLKMTADILYAIRCPFSYEYPAFTRMTAYILIGTAPLHFFLPFRYILFLGVVYLFAMWTPPYAALMRYIFGSLAAWNAYQQEQLARKKATEKRSATTKLKEGARKIMALHKLKKGAQKDD